MLFPMFGLFLDQSQSFLTLRQIIHFINQNFIRNDKLKINLEPLLSACFCVLGHSWIWAYRVMGFSWQDFFEIAFGSTGGSLNPAAAGLHFCMVFIPKMRFSVLLRPTRIAVFLPSLCASSLKSFWPVPSQTIANRVFLPVSFRQLVWHLACQNFCGTASFFAILGFRT